MYTAIGIPKGQVLEDALRTQQHYYLVIGVILLLSLILGTIIASVIIKPLGIITKTTKKVREGNFHHKLPIFHYKELDELGTVYNQMTDKVDYLINQVYKKQLLLQDAELEMLQSQVNPHFLFNVLDTISWEAIMNGQEEIHKMLNNLAELIRRNIVFSKREMILIEEELRYIDYYVQLQQFRFEDQLVVDITLEDEELNKRYIPKLSLQPFIDNAIVHGIEPKDGIGHVSLHIATSEDMLMCTIKDDGVGYDTSVPIEPEGHKSKHNHIGIMNVRKRIELLCGDRYTWRITSKIGEGTLVEIGLPIIEEEGKMDVSADDCR